MSHVLTGKDRSLGSVTAAQASQGTSVTSVMGTLTTAPTRPACPATVTLQALHRPAVILLLVSVPARQVRDNNQTEKITFLTIQDSYSGAPSSLDNKKCNLAKGIQQILIWVKKKADIDINISLRLASETQASTEFCDTGQLEVRVA